MPPRKAGVKSGKSGSVGAKRKTLAPVKDTKDKLDAEFLNSLTGDASDKDMERLFTLAVNCANKDDGIMVQEICGAIVRISQSNAGFLTLFYCGALENLTNIMPLIKSAALDIQLAFNAVIGAAARYLDDMDHCECFNLPKVLDLALKLAGEHKVVALSAVATLDRFAMHMQWHRVSILKGGGLHLLHQILATHRTPEFCQETMMLIYHICDVPKTVMATDDPEEKNPLIKTVVLEEISLIKTVTETLDEAPVNMRLQFTGLRLISLWLNLEDKKIVKALHAARAPETLQTALENLKKGGFSHAVAWLDGIASGAFGCAAKGKKQGKAQSNASSDGRSNGET